MKETNETRQDDDLVRECIEGNDAAWSALVEKYRNLIFSIPLKYGLSVDEASEILQEVFLKLLSELPRIREPRTLPAWLIRVTSNECFHWKKKQRVVTLPVAGGIEEFSATPGVDDTIIDEVRQEQILRQTIADQPPRCQRLIEMLFFTTPPVPYEVVAESLGIAKGSVGFIRMRCLKRLRRLLEERGFR